MRRGEEEQKQKSTKTDLDRKKDGSEGERGQDGGGEGGFSQTEEAFVCKTAIAEGEKGLGSADELMR